jgi:hypothetical protein
VLVFTDHGELGRVGNQTRIGAATFRVRFYLELGVDLARDEIAAPAMGDGARRPAEALDESLRDVRAGGGHVVADRRAALRR